MRKVCDFSSRETCYKALIMLATPCINETAWTRIPYHNGVPGNEAQADRGESRLARSMIRSMLPVYSASRLKINSLRTFG